MGRFDRIDFSVVRVRDLSEIAGAVGIEFVVGVFVL